MEVFRFRFEIITEAEEASNFRKEKKKEERKQSTKSNYCNTKAHGAHGACKQVTHSRKCFAVCTEGEVHRKRGSAIRASMPTTARQSVHWLLLLLCFCRQFQFQRFLSSLIIDINDISLPPEVFRHPKPKLRSIHLAPDIMHKYSG